MKKDLFQKITKPFLIFILRLLYWPKIINKKVIPKKGPIILVANHTHHFDPVLIMSGTNRVVHFLSKIEHSKTFLGPAMQKFGVIFVDRSLPKNDEVTAKLMAKLNEGKAIALFPEGTRNKTEKLLLPLKFGAVSMARKTGATIVPASITGTYKAFKPNKLTIEFGKPFKVEQADDLERANEHLAKTLKELLRKNGDTRKDD